MSLLSHHQPDRQSLTKGAIGSPFRKDYSFESKYSPSYVRYDQPEALLEYELARQKEKSRILEERLKNKEIFIAQMKQFQNELTQAFDESQQELAYYKSKCEQQQVVSGQQQHRTSNNEEIAELKKQLKAAEQQKRRLEEDLKVEKHRMDRSLSRSSLQKSKTDHQLNANRMSSLSVANKDKIAQTLARCIDTRVQQVTKEIKHIGKFLSYFLTMVQTCNPNFNTDQLKSRLKFAWKWIKTIVKEHTETRGSTSKSNTANISNDKSNSDQQLAAIAKLLNVPISDIRQELEAILHEHRHADRILRVVAEFCGLPPESSLKHIEKCMREKITTKRRQ